MPDRLLNLEVERLQAERQWRETLDEYVPLAIAAATALHQLHPTANGTCARRDYWHALNVAAAALSRFVSVYTLDARQERVEFRIDLGKQRFALGATQVRSANGQVIEPLLVRRSDAASALPVIQQAGLPYSFL